ncbi:MAG TPA: hypothetical protein VK787_15735, partial [Puia sp.]|nr:hypothetical protein [Puia sp.]
SSKQFKQGTDTKIIVNMRLDPKLSERKKCLFMNLFTNKSAMLASYRKKIEMMKKIIVIILVFVFGFGISSDAQIEIAAIIKEGVTKIIKAVDLKIQRLQTQTIWLQNAQKEIENVMTKLKLDEISDWVQKQKDLYQEYYNELWQVKQVISDYDKVQHIISLQTKIINEYNSAYTLFKQDKNFSASEISWMYNVYSGIINESLKNVEQALLVVNALVTQMSDGERLKIIDNANSGMQKNYNDLKQFNSQNIQLSLQRAAENNDAGSVKQLYGLQ